jgi:hypothetical protein
MGAKGIDYLFTAQFMQFSPLRDLGLIECGFLYLPQRLFDEPPAA